MKKFRTVMILALSIFLLISCQGESPVRDVRVSSPRGAEVSGPYEIDGRVQPAAGNLVPGMSIGKATDGEHALTYYVNGEKKVSLFTVDGDDVEFVVPPLELDVPEEVWSSVDMNDKGAHVALLVLMKDGNGSKLEFSVTFDSDDPKMPKIEYTPVGWKKNGNTIEFSFGEKPDWGRITKSGLDMAGKKWAESTGVPNADKSPLGSWLLFSTGAVEEGLPSLFRSNLKIDEASWLVLSELDLEAIPAIKAEEIPEIKGLGTGLRMQAGVALDKPAENSFDLRFSENGSIMVVRLKTDIPGLRYVRFPLLRAPESETVVEFAGMEMPSSVLTDLKAAVDTVSKTPISEKLTVSDMFIKAGSYPVSDGRTVLFDASGKWNDGASDWYSYYGAAWTGTANEDGRILLALPSVNKRTDFVEADSAAATRKTVDIASFENKDDRIVKTVVNGKTYTRSEVQSDMTAVLDSLSKALFGSGLESVVLRVDESGKLGVIVAEKFIPLFGSKANENEICLYKTVTKEELIKLLPEAAAPAFKLLPENASVSLMLPLKPEGIELIRTDKGSITFPLGK